MVALALFVICVSIFIWLVVKSFRAQRESTYGPRLYPIVGSLIELLQNMNRFLEWSTEYLIKAPERTVSMQRPGNAPFRLTANPANVEHILKTNFENYPKGDHIGLILTDLLGEGIFNADDGLWRMQRKLASYEFTTRSLRDYLMDALAEEIKGRLIPTVMSVHDKGVEVDLQDIFLRFAFDNICKLAFGVDPACLDPSFPTVKFVQAFDTATSLSTFRFFVPHPIVWKVKKALNIGSERKLKEALATIDEFATSVISSRREAVKNGKMDNEDLLSRFMSPKQAAAAGDEEAASKQSQDRSGEFSDKFLRDIIISFVLAGRDTTSVTLAWFFWILSSHPRVEEQLIKEIEDIGGVGKATFSFEELKSMHYLQASLFESMRLYPAVPVDTKVARDSDVWPDGTRIEKGMRCTYHVYAMGRMESLWGEDCAEFKPERWIKEGRFVPESPFKFTAFQAGPRICLGKDLAILQMKAVVAALLPNFQFVLREGFQPRYKLNLTMPMDCLPVRAKLRK